MPGFRHCQRLHCKLGEKLQVIGDRHSVGDRQHDLRDPHRPGHGIMKGKRGGDVLDMDDIEADDRTNGVGDGE